MKIGIEGGMSIPNRITILSDEFISTAQSNEKGKITCMVRHRYLWTLSRFLFRNKDKNKYLPILQLIRICLFFAEFISKKIWILLGLFLAAVALMQKYSPTSLHPSRPPNLISVFLEQYWWIPLIVTIIGTFIYMWLHVAPWHGAEHMAIAAYNRTGSTDIKDIAKESPVHDKCGTRLYLPLLAGVIIAELVNRNFGVSNIITIPVIFLIVLWADSLIGWDKIPGISHASRFIQKRITTCVPKEQELLTAQRAMQELIAAHQAIQNSKQHSPQQ